MDHPDGRMHAGLFSFSQWTIAHKRQTGLAVAAVVITMLSLLYFFSHATSYKDLKQDAFAPTTTLRHASSYQSVFEKTLRPLSASRGTSPVEGPAIPGISFVNAAISSIHEELYRFWGWRPNDLAGLTDNVRNTQRGVLEVTRRTSTALTRNIARAGSAEPFNPGLEKAMNAFMIRPDRFWFPSAESRYRSGIREWKTYLSDLEVKKAKFHTRRENLIPLLSEYEQALGECFDNLVRMDVDFFEADDHFYYAQGIALAMKPMLEAALTDFGPILDQRHADVPLHQAIQMLYIATGQHPWIILNSDLGGFWANHRANMAAPIGHARFHIGKAIRALSS